MNSRPQERGCLPGLVVAFAMAALAIVAETGHKFGLW